MTHGDLPRLDAIILAGGASRRMGVDKAAQVWGDRRAIDHVVALAASLDARRIVTAGPADLGRPHVPDPAPLSGPVAGILAGLRWLGAKTDRVLVLTVDAPTIQRLDLIPLIEAPGNGAAFAGFPAPLVLRWSAAPRDAEDNWSLRRFAERAGLAQIAPDPAALERLRGANTPQERETLARAAGWV